MNRRTMPDWQPYPLEQHWDNKEADRACTRPAKYEPIHRPRNTSAGVFVSLFGLALFCALIGTRAAGATISIGRNGWPARVDAGMASSLPLRK